jgi:phospholipase C
MSTYIIGRNSENNLYEVWAFQPGANAIFKKHPLGKGAGFDPSYRLAAIGGYLLAWSPLDPKTDQFAYRLFEFDPASPDPLGGAPVQEGHWPTTKFWGYRKYYSNNPDEKNHLTLIPMGGNFMLFFVGGEGRGTYELFNFDPNLKKEGGSDPLPAPYTGQGAFPTIQAGHELIPIKNYVLDRGPDGESYRLWSFDPQDPTPLSIPEVCSGKWKDIDASQKLVPVGEHLLQWTPGKTHYRLWEFDPSDRDKDPLGNLLYEGELPGELAACDSLLAVEPRIPQVAVGDPSPGTLDFMRSKIKHVVYYMVESRSFDNVCGWLYEEGGDKIHYIGDDRPFEGASKKNYNLDGDRKVYQSKFNSGKLSRKIVLSDQNQDPFHNNADALEQMFYKRKPGYPGEGKPDMGGFVRNNANHEVMLTFSPDQLPVLNGLAKHFAISDEWFSSVPGGTDINRAFSVTGSAMNKLGTWEGGNAYEYWAKYPRRQSLWKVLYNNGISDWKIYNVIDWLGYPFTYHLYLEGQIPSVDAKLSDHIESLETFKLQARYGQLPSFSFLEPIWIAPDGTTSYHPGASMVPAEVTLKEIYDAIKDGPNWDSTLLVVTFSKNGGIYDHVAPPYAARPWPNDTLDGFKYDLMGPRVPAIMVSPWIKKHTVIRSGTSTPFDATSFAATLLKWYGIPKSRWGLGDRVDQAPTFEKVFQKKRPRKGAPDLKLPYDKEFPHTKK